MSTGVEESKKSNAKLDPSMKQFLIAEKLTLSEMAKELDITYNYLSRVLRKESKPGRILAMEIEIRTRGLVRMEDLLPPDVPRERCTLCGRMGKKSC